MNEYEPQIVDDYGNYKEFLASKLKASNSDAKSLDTRIKQKRKAFKARQERHEAELQELVAKRKKAKDFGEEVKTERSYRAKINALLKKHDFLEVFWDGDNDVYTTWIYSNQFYNENDPTADGGGYTKDDPYQDSHFVDSYEEAHGRCLEYIELNTAEVA
mgnify:FL=1